MFKRMKLIGDSSQKFRKKKQAYPSLIYYVSLMKLVNAVHLVNMC
jgi:hypothetical protein